MPWTLLLFVLVLAGAVVLAIVLSRRSSRRRKQQEDARVQEAVDRALREREADSPSESIPTP
ncbi:hypothetical protein [Herbiconiux sp. L3-i23]|uniref:hypothetical protein n=1 Tax=Herbiconiux sp. L3-i23 TaxID=2905871 RepID=UPI0020740865|nr:hypothetical protein [Herbiconiux sp. L3-i23]